MLSPSVAIYWILGAFARLFWRSKGVREARLLQEDVTHPQATVPTPHRQPREVAVPERAKITCWVRGVNKKAMATLSYET